MTRSRASSARAAARLGLLLALVACAPPPAFRGVDPVSGRSFEIAPRPLAEPESLTGHYRSPQLGRMFARVAGGELELEYVRTSCGCTTTGRARGPLAGNRAELELEERRQGQCSPVRLHGSAVVFCQRSPGRPLELHGTREYRVAVDRRENGALVYERRDAGPFRAEQLEPGARVAPDAPDTCP